MNKPIHFSIALIRRIESEVTRWLVIWNPAKKNWECVISQRLEKEVGSETLAREVAWRLNLDRKADFLIGKMAMLNIEMDLNDFGEERINYDDLEDHDHEGKDLDHVDLNDDKIEATAKESDPSSRLVKIEFVPVEIYRKKVIDSLEKQPNVRWVSSAEICDGQFVDGTPHDASTVNSDGKLQQIDPAFVEWNRKWKIIQPWVK